MVSLVFCVKTFCFKETKKNGRPNEGAIGRFPIGSGEIPDSTVGVANSTFYSEALAKVGLQSARSD